MAFWFWAVAMVDEASVAAAMARARATTRIDIPCRDGAGPDEIVVCANRHADRFRVPLVEPRAAGDPRTVDALGERERLLAVPQPACGNALFLERCGFVGVTVSSRTGVHGATPRPLAK